MASLKKALGNPARGEAYYHRKDISDYIIETLHTDIDLQINALRRVGKSSIMWYLVDNQPDDAFVFLIVDSEGIEESNLFFKLIYKEILTNQHLSGVMRATFKSKKFGTKLLEKISKIDVNILTGGASVEFHENLDDEQNYYEELQKLLDALSLQNQRIVMMIDEFPVTVENIEKKYGKDAARLFLENNRRLRQNKTFKEKMLFVYTGSISLSHTVAKLDASITIGDVYSIEVPPLSEAEAIDFINRLLENQTISSENLTYLLSKIQWYIPYYIQIIVEELKRLLKQNPIADNAMIDTALAKAVKTMSDVFKHWKQRLKKTFEGNELKLALHILNAIAEKDTMEYNEIQNQAAKLKVKNVSELIEVLHHDGYLTDKSPYRFNSPILKNWWKQHDK